MPCKWQLKLSPKEDFTAGPTQYCRLSHLRVIALTPAVLYGSIGNPRIFVGFVAPLVQLLVLCLELVVP